MQKKKPDTPVWKKKKPKGTKSIKLTEAQKQEARERAERAGRQYPNLVDNMAVARKAKKNA